MVESEFNDDTWEDFFGSSQELMPTIMGAFDAIIGSETKENELDLDSKTSTPRRSHQISNFANLSPYVQKVLSNVPEQEISRKFSSEETLGPKRFNTKSTYRSFRSPDKHINKSNENLEIISTNVQKMLSNLPDTELVISASNLNLTRNSSYLFNSSSRTEFLKQILANGEKTSEEPKTKQFLYHSDGAASGNNSDRIDADDVKCCASASEHFDNCDNYDQKPLGSYLHSSQGIASRTPVGRKNVGKYLQVPSENSVGNTSSTTSSEVSRPVSLTSLGSCSSSGSSGHNQPGSAYLASAESLDSDPEPSGSQGSADSGIAVQEQSIISPESRVLHEVLETETVYVEDLNEVITGYLDPWKSDPECPLAEYLSHLFSNLEKIYKFNRSFLKDLKEAEGEATKTANCFLHHDSGFSVYNEYCQNYPRTMEVLGRLTRDEKMAALFREKQLELGHALPLGSYLLKPVQRILKYHLLLQRLSKQCDPTHKPTVDLALTTMTGIASDINNMKRKNEDAVRVQEIQAQLYGWNGPDLTALGELIAEGTFRVVGARGRRHVFLFEKVLLLAKNKQGGALAYKSHIMTSNLMLVEQVRGEPLSFQVIPFDNPRLQSTLKARSPQHKREWTLQIKRVILENYTAVIPNHARQLVLQLGQELNETDTNNDKWLPLKQYSTPNYLERRSRVRKTRDFANRRAASQDRTFPTLTNWRRKSEPSMVPQYNPKKTLKIKKQKEIQNATFYTDLSDSENCADESMENLQQSQNEVAPNESNNEDKTDECVKNNLEKIVSDILMQNQTFQKAFCRQISRKSLTSDPTSVWYEDKVKLPTKADSLPRSFQLYDQPDSNDAIDGRNDKLLDMSLKEDPDIEVEEQQDNDFSSQLSDAEHPDHKIYRKSAIRFSILQRIRHIMTEEQKRTQKFPVYQQGSKRMGEKIAHPDYVDPQKLFLGSANCSQVDLTEYKIEDCDILGEPEQLDLSICEKDVLNELEKRLNGGSSVPDTGQTLNSSHSLNSSQISDSYYENILEDSLKEEYVEDSTGKLVAKQDSFSSNEEKQKPNQKSLFDKRPAIKRPTKAPPPIPQKPARLSQNVGSIKFVTEKTSFKNVTQLRTAGTSTTRVQDVVSTVTNSTTSTTSNSSWVKAMVGRFE
ncbi:uncharacterized protein LOC130892421 isoform X4 [Diorhabda carinulata]|uniref:uncharacterized protein LOC130892421 isoform X4 n=1 Tax=Diorhabda carinulata TaxID=1163345 RepID=UPI0025A051C6|nr:uncharacterized protein LOC130892421 isoform X4 [Diorhabda carinulata]